MSRPLIIVLAIIAAALAVGAGAAFLFLYLGEEPPVGRELALHTYDGETYVLVEYDDDLAVFTAFGLPVTSRDRADSVLHSYAWKQIVDDLDYAGIAKTVRSVQQVDSSISGVRSASNQTVDIFNELDSIGANIPFKGRVTAMDVVKSSYPGLDSAERAIRSLNPELNRWGENTNKLVDSTSLVAELRESGDFEGDDLVKLFSDAASSAQGVASTASTVKGGVSEAQSSAARLESALRDASDTPIIGGAIGGLASTAGRFETKLGDLTSLLGDFESDLDQLRTQFQNGLTSASTTREGYMSRWLAQPHDPQWPPTDPERVPAVAFKPPSGPPVSGSGGAPTPSTGVSVGITPVAGRQTSPAPPVSITLDAGQPGELAHVSGARIEIPDGATAEAVTVSIEEVPPPDSIVKVARVFDFSIGDATLLAPVTLHIPFDLEPGMDTEEVSALHWNEDLQVWLGLPREVDEVNGTVAVTVSDLSIFSTAFSLFSSSPLEERVIIPEIVKISVSPKNPLAKRPFQVHFALQNAGDDSMSGEVDGVGYVELYLDNALVQRSKDIKAKVPRGPDNWKPGQTLTSKVQANPFEYTAPRIGPLSFRVELVFESGSGVEIARDSAELEVMATDLQVIAPTKVTVDGQLYEVFSETDSRGRVEYSVPSAVGAIRDKAIYTAYTQQVIRGPEALFVTRWSGLLEFGASVNYWEAKYGDDVAFALEMTVAIGAAWMFPNPFTIKSAKVKVSTAVAEKLIKEFSNNPEEMVEGIALEVIDHSNELLKQNFDLQKRIQNGEPLSFQDAVLYRNSIVYWNSYRSPARKAVTMINEGLVPTAITFASARETGDLLLHQLGFAAAAPHVQGLVSLTMVLSALHELGIPLAEYEPWKVMEEEGQANLDRERDQYSELLAQLGLSQDYFQLPALAQIPIPHYSTLTGGGGTGEGSQDRTALVALYNATGGRNWRSNDNWLSDAPISEWHGVVTDGAGRVTELNLSENGLTGEIPAELGVLPNLEHLEISGNQLSGCIPAALRDVVIHDDGQDGLALLYCDEAARLSGPFKLEWETSASSVEFGDSFTLAVRMYGLQQAGEHGGISVSFPALTDSGGSERMHSSSRANVEMLDYTTGLSNVTFYQPGATIYRDESGEPAPFPAEYLLVESDDPSWSRSDDRTLRLRITPEFIGEFLIRIRGWVCAEEYADCLRNPDAGTVTDQQGWIVEQVSVQVENFELPPLDPHYSQWERFIKPGVHENANTYIPQSSDFGDPDTLVDDGSFLIRISDERKFELVNTVVGFRTWLYHEGSAEYEVGISGDDGVALYVNEEFVAGRGNAEDPASYGPLALNNGWNKIEALVYNGPLSLSLKLEPALSKFGVIDAGAYYGAPAPGKQNGTTTGRTPEVTGDAIRLLGGRINGQSLNVDAPTISVSSGEAISGGATISVTNAHRSHAVFPVGATPSWGPHASSYWTIDGWATAMATTEYEVPINLTAPMEPGTYAIIFAAAAETSLAHVMSATHWASGSPTWDDGDDIAEWNTLKWDSAIRHGFVIAPHVGKSSERFGAAVIRIEVSPPKTVLMPETPGEPSWSYYVGVVRTDPDEGWPPLVEEGVLYVASGYRDGYLYALGAYSGDLLWRRQIVASRLPPVVKNGILYAYHFDLHALDASTGRTLWDRDNIHDYNGITAADNMVFIPEYAPHRYMALEASSGEELWSHETENYVGIRPMVADGIFYGSRRDGLLFALDQYSGNLLWSYEVDLPNHPHGNMEDQPPTLYNQTLFLANTDGYVDALDASTGRLKWRYAIESYQSVLTVSEGRVYVTKAGAYVALDASNGEELWRYDFGEDPDSPEDPAEVAFPPVVGGGIAYVGLDEGNLFALDAVSGRLLWTREIELHPRQSTTGSSTRDPPTASSTHWTLQAASRAGATQPIRRSAFLRSLQATWYT